MSKVVDSRYWGVMSSAGDVRGASTKSPIEPLEVQKRFISGLASLANQKGILRRNGLLKAFKALSADKEYQPLFEGQKPKNDGHRLEFLHKLVQDVYDQCSNDESVRSQCRDIEDALKMTKNSVAHANIRKVAKRSRLSMSHFYVSYIKIGPGAPVAVIKTNNLFWRILNALFESSEHALAREVEVVKTIAASVTVFSSLQEEEFIRGGEMTRRFFSAQRFNQAMASSKREKRSLAEVLTAGAQEAPPAVGFPSAEVKVGSPSVMKELAPVTATVTTFKAAGADVEDRPIQKGAVLRYPGDDVSHEAEGLRIFLRTLALNIRAIWDKNAHYLHGLEEAQVRAADQPTRASTVAPSTFMVGHSDNIIGVPLRAKDGSGYKTFNVITDPIEGDLIPLLYSRMTQEGRMLQECPAIHVMLLSHNHFDHYSEPTISKLLEVQPVMIVPKGDGARLKSLGFVNVHEQNWWDKSHITFTSDQKDYDLFVTAVPSRHWAGRGAVGAGSGFVGHVIQGAEGGDIYCAGDTARLNSEHLKKMRDKFRIQYMFQPGGPDEKRSDMESTHQSSADSLWMYKELYLKKLAEQHWDDKSAFLRECLKKRVIANHTSTYRLGELYVDDTAKSIDRVLLSLKKGPAEPISGLADHETKVVSELIEFCDKTTFGFGKLTYEELADILRQTVYVPKIGARIDFEKSKVQHQGRLQF